MKKSADPQAPKHLKPPTRRWWSSVVSGYVLAEHHERLLTAAGESWDRAQQAREIVSTEGMVISDRFGQPKEHPAVRIERDCKALFAKLIRELALDLDPPAESRPPSSVGRLRVER
jgi:P27 family predicted phage terminase small subunit